jgi:DNA-binding transcriptional LysR family regulator
MDRFRAMTVFVAAAQAGSLSGAARRLSMPLTTVSRHLAWLETHVGTTLISRTTRHMALTDAGSTYLEICRRVLDDLDGAESALAGRGRELAGDFTMRRQSSSGVCMSCRSSNAS